MADLSDESRKTVDEYLRRLGEGLSELPEDERADAVAEARSHIEEAVARIREDETAAVGTVLRGLGEPEAFAEGLLAGDAQKGPAATAQPAPVALVAGRVHRRTAAGDERAVHRLLGPQLGCAAPDPGSRRQGRHGPDRRGPVRG